MIKTQIITDENDNPQLVIMDYQTYQELIDKIDILESNEILKTDTFHSAEDVKQELGL